MLIERLFNHSGVVDTPLAKLVEHLMSTPVPNFVRHI